jgi:hypothetical protein
MLFLPSTAVGGFSALASPMAIGRSARRLERQPRVEATFGKDTAAVLDLLELTEFAWHDCYGEISPPDDVVDDILVCAEGDLAKAMHAARLAVEDMRDLKMWAQALRSEKGGDAKR